jgi:hypothetical protein
MPVLPEVGPTSFEFLSKPTGSQRKSHFAGQVQLEREFYA